MRIKYLPCTAWLFDMLEFNPKLHSASIKMEYSKQVYHFIAFYLLFGLWAIWQKPHHTLLLRVYSVLVASALIVVYFNAIFLNAFYNISSLASSVSGMLFSTTLLTHLIIIFETTLKSKTQFQLIQKLSLVDRMISTKLNRCIPYRNEKRVVFTRIIVLTVIVFLTKSVFIIHALYQNNMYSFLYCIAFSKWTMHLRAIQVLFFVFLVQTRLDLITKEIKTNQFMQINEQFEQSMNTERTTFNQILNLKIIFGELYEIHELVNKTFGWSLLAIITQCFIDLLSNCYWVFLYVVEGVAPQLQTFIVMFSFMVPIFTTLGALSFYCSSYYQQVSTFFHYYFGKNVLKYKILSSRISPTRGSYDRNTSSSHSN